MPVCPICHNPLMAGEALIFDGNVLWHDVNVEADERNTLGRKVHTSNGWCGRNVRVAPLPGVEVKDCPCGSGPDASIHALTAAECAGLQCHNPAEHHQYGHPGMARAG